MNGRFERGLVIGYAHNIAKGVSRLTPIARTFVDWANCQDWLQFNEASCDPLENDREFRGSRFKQRRSRSSTATPSESAWVELNSQLSKIASACRNAPPGLFQRNLNALSDRFGLSPTERKIFNFVVRYRSGSPVNDLCNSVAQIKTCDPLSVAAAMIGISRARFAACIRDTGRLLSSGLLIRAQNVAPTDFILDVSSSLIDACHPPANGYDDVVRRLIGQPNDPNLDWEAFSHIAEDRDFAFDVLNGAIRRRVPGINILLYGPPGTGKTEFCKTLTARLGLRLYAAADSNDDGEEPNRWERVAKIRLSQTLLANDGQAALLFDEAEDILESPGIFGFFGKPRRAMGGSKVFLNRMLEQNRVPTFWTCNSIAAFDPAFLRRMMLAIEIRTPTAPIRERFWAEALSSERISAEPADVRRLAREFEASPAVVTAAAKAARLSGGGIDKVRHAVRAAEKAMRGGVERPPRPLAPTSYDPILAVADRDLADLADRLSASGSARNFSLCLFGAPGTGKSAFARHLADRLGIEAIQKRASDLLSMWVGESEKNIAAAFAEARDSRALLIFDEADSLLRDRRGADRSWEVTQVNEMLTWMECHDQPFACTTNLMEALDPAALRRFTFKVRFEYLGPKEIAHAFRVFFGLDAPAHALSLPVLTPGDFAVVARKANLLGVADSTDGLARMLAEECEVKPDRPRRIGFGA